MKVTVAIEFPCSQEEWSRLERIRQVAGFENVSIPERGGRFESQEVQAAELEGKLLLDHCIKNNVGKCKPTQVGMLREYIEANPGSLSTEVLEAVHVESGIEIRKLDNSLRSLIYGSKAIAKIGGRLYLN